MTEPKTVALTAGAAGAIWRRKHPSACPYAQRFWVQPPQPPITRQRLRDTLQPQPGERVLEIGPGTGYHTPDMAEWARKAASTSSTSSRRCSTTRCAAPANAACRTSPQPRATPNSCPTQTSTSAKAGSAPVTVS